VRTRVDVGEPGSERSAAGRVLGPGPAVRWRPARRPLDPALVLRLAGYRRVDEATPPIREAATRMATRADALVEPEAWWRVVSVADADETGARLREGPRFTGRAIGLHLGAGTLAVAFVLTIGGALEAEVLALGEAREPLDAFLLDTAGWAEIEQAVRELRLDLRVRARDRGWRLTHRLAPGYADWPVEEQSHLLGLFADRTLPVRLSEHGVLVPFKSITGVFGVPGSQITDAS